LYYEKGEISPNIDKSISNAYEFYVLKKDSILNEIKKCMSNNGFGLIYSAASPLAFDIAKEYKMKSLLVSNFDWLSVFKNLNCNTNPLKNKKYAICKSLEESYSKNNLILKLPLSDEKCFFINDEMKIREIGFFSREKTMNRNIFLDKFDMDDKFTIFLSFGKTLKINLNKIKNLLDQKQNQEYNIIMSNVNKKVEGIYQIPENETESQNWVGNCDLFIGKPGWGTMTECIMNNVKMLLVPIASNIESNKLIDYAIRIGGTGSIDPIEFESMSWLKNIYKRSIIDYQNNLNLNGKEEIIKEIKKILEF
ncbi:MAG: hypothetical protein ACTSR1_06045, partial [Candidatus Heimdallarchaeota archaeon]